MYEQGEMSYRAIARTRFTIINQLRKNLLSVSQKKSHSAIEKYSWFYNHERFRATHSTYLVYVRFFVHV